jgi:Xaa-Pro aminopeptidase
MTVTDAHRLNQEKIIQAKVYLQEMGIDCWLIKTKEGSDPCMPLLFGLSIVGDAILMVTPTSTLAITSSIDAQDVRESGLFDEVLTYSRSGLAQLLLATVQRINPKRIALNYSKTNHLSDGLTVGSYRKLLAMLTDTYATRVESSEPFLQKLRSIKSPLEVAYIQQAIDITLDIYDEVFTKVRKGMTEIEIGELFVQGMIARNVVSGITRKLTPPIVMNHHIAHRPPGNSILKEGDYLIFDFSVDYKGYCSDIARTCYVLKEGETEASESMRKAFETIYEAINRAMAALKVGAIGKDVDHVARQHILDCGYQNIFHAVGHQVGRDVHDGGTILGPEKKSYRNASLGVIEEGMVFAIEPTILYEDGPAIISEENVLVTAQGAKLLSRRQEALVLIH